MMRTGGIQRKRGQRAYFHDYCAPGYYLITATVEEGPYPLLRLSKMPDISAERLKKPDMIIPIFTNLGMLIQKEIESIPTYHPKLEVKRYVIMPDHIHLVIFVRERLERKLGSELAGFFGACTRRFRELLNSQNPILTNSSIKDTSLNKFSIKDSSLKVPAIEDSALKTTKLEDLGLKAPIVEDTALEAPSVSLFQPFHDRIIFNFNQLRRSVAYVEDNPRRYIIKKLYPQLFKRYLHVKIKDQEYGMMGNIFLMKEINLLPVRIHRRWSEEEFDEYERNCKLSIEEGAVVISPAIHKREKDILNWAIKAGGKVIKLIDGELKERFKPSGKLFNLCAEGRLLLLAPWQAEGGKKHSGYTEFHNMNDIARSISEMPADTRMTILSGLH